MTAHAMSFHLLFEQAGESVSHPPGNNVPEDESWSRCRLEIRNDISYVDFSLGTLPREAQQSGKKPENVVLFQPIWDHLPHRLLMVNPAGLPLKVNGRPAPPLSLLKEKDEVSPGPLATVVAHVVLHHNPRIGPPDKGEIGKPCLLCNSRIIRDTTLYRCCRCGKALHLEGDDKPEKVRLECARICSECPACRTPIVFETGYRYTPECFQKR